MLHGLLVFNEPFKVILSLFPTTASTTNHRMSITCVKQHSCELFVTLQEAALAC